MEIITIVHAVRVRFLVKRLALAAVVVGLVTGCNGINTTQSISPLMFFLPGIAQAKPVSPQIVPLMQTASPAQVIAFNRDAAKAN